MLGVLWMGKGWGLGAREQDSPVRISDTHLFLLVQVGPVVPAVAVAVGNVLQARIQLPGH